MVNKKLISGAIGLVLLAAIVLMGLAVVEGFSKTFRTTTGVTNMTMTTGAVNISTRIGTSEQYPYPQTLTFCTNDTVTMTDSNYTWTEGTVDGGTLTLTDAGSDWVTTQVNCTGTYLADSTLQGHADKFTTGLAIFGSFIGVLVLAILGMYILNLFRRKE